MSAGHYLPFILFLNSRNNVMLQLIIYHAYALNSGKNEKELKCMKNAARTLNSTAKLRFGSS